MGESRGQFVNLAYRDSSYLLIIPFVKMQKAALLESGSLAHRVVNMLAKVLLMLVAYVQRCRIH